MSLTDNLNQAKAELNAEPSPTKDKEPRKGSAPQNRKPASGRQPKHQVKEPAWKPKLEPKGGRLTLNYKAQIQGHVFENTNEIADSKATEYLYPLLKPLCKLVNAVVNRELKALESPGPRHVLDENGRPTKEIEKDDNGKPVYLPSALEIAKTAYSKMVADPEVVKLLGAINNRLKTLDEAIQDGDDQGGNSESYTPVGPK